MKNITTDGATLEQSEWSCPEDSMGDGDPGPRVNVQRKPDDPLCLRASIGGTRDDGYYLVFRGEAVKIELMLTSALVAIRAHQKGL